jgi:hypothetical protein
MQIRQLTPSQTVLSMALLSSNHPLPKPAALFKPRSKGSATGQNAFLQYVV